MTAAISVSFIPGPMRSRDVGEDLFRLGDRGADTSDLERRLAPAQRPDDGLRRDESIGVRRALQSLAEHEPEPVSEAVRSRVARRVVDRDRLRREALDRLAEPRPDALVVLHDLGVRPELLDARRVVAPDDRDPLARARHQERALPRAIRAGDQVQTGVASEERLADEREPEIDALLLEDRGRLVELLADKRRHRSRPQDLIGSRRGAGTSDHRQAGG